MNKMNQNQERLINFQEVSSEIELKGVEVLAFEIWREHYTPIIGSKQVDYMLDKFQSVQTMKEQIINGYRYYSINNNDNPVGYLAYTKRRKDLFLSKIYVLKGSRGQGIGKKAMLFIMDTARALGCEKVSLTVNKFNKNSIKAYESIGFVNKEALVQDIGGGFIMDDYLMEYSL